MPATLQVHLRPQEMARLIDGGSVTIETNGGRRIILTGSVPDWSCPQHKAAS